MRRVIILYTALIVISFATPKLCFKITIDEDYLKDTTVAYTAQHDIISITVPFYCDKDAGPSLPIFFVEGDRNADGGYDYKGLYKLTQGQASLILENGRAGDAYIVSKNSSLVFLGASDGIYVYDLKLNKTEKYGTLTDSILNIAKENGTDTLYILTDDHSVYKVTEGGNVKTKIEDIQNAKKIALDFSNNLYFLGVNNLPYLYTTNGIKNIAGLPSKPGFADLMKSPLHNNKSFYVSDGSTFFITADGTSEPWFFDIGQNISAYNTEAYFLRYYALDKKIHVIYSDNTMLRIINCLRT